MSFVIRSLSRVLLLPYTYRKHLHFSEKSQAKARLLAVRWNALGAELLAILRPNASSRACTMTFVLAACIFVRARTQNNDSTVADQNSNDSVCCVFSGLRLDPTILGTNVVI